MSYDVALWSFSPSPEPMRKCNEQALIGLKADLKLNVNVKDSGMIDMLEIPLGFLNRAEMQDIKACTTDRDRMDKIIGFLRGKADKCFSKFCDILAKSNNETWAEKLRKQAEEFERNPPGKCYSMHFHMQTGIGSLTHYTRIFIYARCS